MSASNAFLFLPSLFSSWPLLEGLIWKCEGNHVAQTWGYLHGHICCGSPCSSLSVTSLCVWLHVDIEDASFTLVFTLHHSSPPFLPHTYSWPTFSFCVSFHRSRPLSPLLLHPLRLLFPNSVHLLPPSFPPSILLSAGGRWVIPLAGRLKLSLSLSKYIFSILLISCLSTSLSPLSSPHTSLCSVPPSVSLHPALFCRPTTKLVPPSSQNFCHDYVSLCQSASQIYFIFYEFNLISGTSFFTLRE